MWRGTHSPFPKNISWTAINCSTPRLLFGRRPGKSGPWNLSAAILRNSLQTCFRCYRLWLISSVSHKKYQVIVGFSESLELGVKEPGVKHNFYAVFVLEEEVAVEVHNQKLDHSIEVQLAGWVHIKSLFWKFDQNGSLGTCASEDQLCVFGDETSFEDFMIWLEHVGDLDPGALKIKNLSRIHMGDFFFEKFRHFVLISTRKVVVLS